MKISLRTVLLAVVIAAAWANSGEAAEVTNASRTKESFCETWRFQLGEKEGAEKAGFDDSTWRTLDVPHDWSIELPYDPSMSGGSAVAYLPGGIGWYRKSFTLPKSDIGKSSRSTLRASIWTVRYGSTGIYWDAFRTGISGFATISRRI